MKTNIIEEEIKTCPFCGRIPIVWWDHLDQFHECYNEGFNIECVCCEIRISAIYKEDAIEKWNNRIKYND
jgi:Lar family restriction alleviation protein